MSASFRVLALAWTVLFVAAAGVPAHADYPEKPVRLVVPFPPGGVVDVMARLLAPHLSERFGRNFYVDNHPGAGGSIGAAHAAGQPADGYAVMITSSSFMVNPSLNAKVPYDPIKDFSAVTIAAASPNVLVVHPSLPARSVLELVELVEKNPNKYGFASAGTGTTPHLSGELFRLSQKLDLVHVPFPGAGPALASAVAGHTPIAFTGVPGAAGQVKGMKLRALAVTSAQRSSAMPEVPTMEEAGVKGQEAETLISVLVPAGTPDRVIATLNAEVARIVKLPQVRERLASLGFDPVATTPEEASKRIREEIEKWGDVIRQAKIAAK